MQHVPAKTVVIPAAGRGLKPYPAWDTVEKLLHPIIDTDGLAKPVLQILVQDALAAGLDNVVLIIGPNEEVEYRRQLNVLAETLQHSPASRPAQRTQGAWLADLQERLSFVVQDQPLGLGHALHCARSQIAGGYFLVMLSDHLPLSYASDGRRCAAQVIDCAHELPGPISTVEPLPEHLLHRYGVVAGIPVPGRKGIWSAERVVEKPTPTQAELDLETPGLRRGEYLGYTGMHFLPIEALERIAERLASGAPGAGDLSPILDELARRGGYHVLRVTGVHQDIGTAYGLLEAQLERSLLGPDRDKVLARVVDILGRDALRAEKLR